MVTAGLQLFFTEGKKKRGSSPDPMANDVT
jgi:hypothetical protein